MWTRLKKRILQLFTEEEMSEQANDNQGSKNNSTQYKSEPRQINHKYQRSERSFRFPVIPDNPSEFTQTNNPYEKHHQKKQQKKQVRQRELLRTYETITPLQPKQTNKPFVPSRVASPIYGYNKRTDTQTIEQVPTFMRNKQTKQHKPLDDERVTPLTKDNELDQANNFAGKHHSLKAR